MKRNQKGITIVGLLITVIVIVTIASVCIYTGRDILEEAKLEQVKTNMLLIQAKCHSIHDKVTAGEEAAYIGTKRENGYTVNGYTVDDSQWYELSAENVKNDIGLGNIEVSSGDYLVNYEENEVIYTKGYNGKYTLTDIIGLDVE